MKTQLNSYNGYRYPGEIISHTVWLYHRFTLSFRDIEDLLAERGIVVTYESIRQWCQKFDLNYAKKVSTLNPMAKPRSGQRFLSYYIRQRR